MGAAHPDRFAAFSGHSSITEFEELKQFVEEPMSAYQNIQTERLSVLETILAAGNQLRPFRFDCGTEDPLIEGNRRLNQRLSDLGLEHEYEELAGAHEWPYWEKHIRKSLSFFKKVLD